MHAHRQRAVLAAAAREVARSRGDAERPAEDDDWLAAEHAELAAARVVRTWLVAEPREGAPASELRFALRVVAGHHAALDLPWLALLGAALLEVRQHWNERELRPAPRAAEAGPGTTGPLRELLSIIDALERGDLPSPITIADDPAAFPARRLVARLLVRAGEEQVHALVTPAAHAVARFVARQAPDAAAAEGARRGVYLAVLRRARRAVVERVAPGAREAEGFLHMLADRGLVVVRVGGADDVLLAEVAAALALPPTERVAALGEVLGGAAAIAELRASPAWLARALLAWG